MKKSEIRIVIVDDEPIIRMDLKEILESKGYQVVGEAADGFDAVELCRTHVPDLVLLDIKMPLNGRVCLLLRLFMSRDLPVLLYF